MPWTDGLTRRGLLALAGIEATVLVTHGAAPARGESRSRSARTPDEARERLKGPILSIPTTFTADYRVDHRGVATMIRRGIEHGIPVFAMTAGNGMYTSLLYDEIKDLTRTMVEAIGGRGVAVAAGGDWWTGQVVDYARFAESLGADVLQVMMPQGCDEAASLEHFKTIASGTSLPLVLQGDVSVSLLQKLIEIPQVIALKEDVTLDFYIDRQRRFGKRLVVFGGGSEHRFLVAHPYGSECFYSAYAVFAPEVSMRFWKAVQAGDTKTPYEMVLKYDLPFLDRWSHGFWRASLEHFGVAKRYLRPPQRSFTDEQMREVKAFYDGLGLYPPPSRPAES